MIQGLAYARNGLLAVHLLCAALWVGGMYYAVMVLRPALAQLEAAKRVQLHMQTLQRFFRLVWHVMPIMLISGWLMVFGVWGGFATVPLSINIMQGLAVLMAGVFVYVYFGPWQQVRRAIRPTQEMLDGVRTLVVVNLVLGVTAIVAGALGHVW
jgi:uncharacterized membrane protein